MARRLGVEGKCSLVLDYPISRLRLQAGEIRRETHATAEGVERHRLAAHEGASRVVVISNCRVTSPWSESDKLNEHLFREGEELELRVYRGAEPPYWPEDPQKIGALDTDGMSANLHLPPEAFTSFWMAAEAYGSAYRINLLVKADPKPKPGLSHILSVIEVGLLETMSTTPPLIAEVKKLSDAKRAIVTGFSILLIILVLVAVLFGYGLTR